MNQLLHKCAALLVLFTFFVGLPVSARSNRKAAEPVKDAFRSETNPVMSSVWKTGTLPPPLALPKANTDEAAAILAQKVAAKTDESIPALLTALQMSGFFVTDRDGKIVLAPPDGKGQGLTINGWEVASAAKMYGDGRTTSASELGERLQSIPEFTQANVAFYLLEGVRRNAENEQNSFLRAWARFIVELGKNSASKYDIAVGAPTDQISLDAIQHLLVLRRLYGDLFALSEKNKPAAQAARAGFRDEARPRFIDAKFSARDAGVFQPLNTRTGFLFSESSADGNRPAFRPDEKQIPCRMDGLAPTVMDGAATAIGTGFGELMGYLENYFEGDRPQPGKIGKMSRLLGIANTLLAYAKFIQTYASLESKIVLEDAPPLVRTKNAAAGERKNLRTEVRVDIGNWQMYNCIRLAMNVTAGIDFATLNDGPLADVGIRWHLDEGGARDVYSNSGGRTGKEQIVGFTQPGAGRIQDRGTSAGTKAGAVKDASYTKTDDKGIARITLEGTPQKNFKGPNSVAVTKQARVRTTIKMKAGEIKGDMVDVAGQAIAGIPGLLTMPAELLYRMDWASAASLTVPVRDWEDCEGKGWNGTIEVGYHKSENNTKVTRKGEHISDQHYSGTRVYKWSYDYRAIFNVKDSPGETYESGNTIATLKGDLSAEASRITDEKDSWTTKGDCAAAGINSTSLIAERGSLTNAIDDGTLIINGGEFKISFLISEIPATRTHRTTVKHFGWCGENQDHDSIDESSMSFSVEGITIEGAVDPKNPNRIEGGKSYTDEMGNEVVIRWSLRNCR